MSNQKQSFFSRVGKGLAVLLKSFQFIRQHKKLMVFPMLAATSLLVTVGVYDVTYYQLYGQHITVLIPKKVKVSWSKKRQWRVPKEYERSSILFYVIMLFAALFIFACADVALSYTVGQLFKNAPASISASLKHGIKRAPTLLAWALCGAVIHIMVALFKNKDERKSSMMSRLGQLVGEAIELAWYIATFLVIPVFAHENEGVFKSIRRSAHLMKATFGENIGSALVFPKLYGLAVVAVLLSWVVIMFGVGFLVDCFGVDLFRSGTYALSLYIVALMVMGVLCGLIAAAVTIFKTSAYFYAIGKPIGLFNEGEIRSGFVSEAEK